MDGQNAGAKTQEAKIKYNQPYGVGNVNASYVNGDPSVGLAGSIPPAEAIEYPQREIVAVISSSNLATPTNADSVQLAKAIQSWLMNSDVDEGTINQYQVTLAPAPTAYYTFLTVRIKIGTTNTGASTLNVNALGSKAIQNADGTAVSGGQLLSGAVVELCYDGTAFRVIGGIAGAAVPPPGSSGGGGGGGPIYLTQVTTLYVNDATGNDAYDGTQATVGTGIRGPFKTMQRASTEINKWNLNGYSVTVNVANGTYTGTVGLPDPGGNGSVSWLGNASTPANCTITTNSGNAVNAAGVKNYMTGFKYTTTGSAAVNACVGVGAQGAVVVVINSFEVGPCLGSAFFAYGGAFIRLGGTKKITGNLGANAFSNGAFLEAILGSKIDCDIVGAAPIILVGSVTYSYFVYAVQLSSVVYIHGGVTGSGTGQRYLANSNSVIGTGGGGANYYPGTVAGAVASGGQYV